MSATYWHNAGLTGLAMPDAEEFETIARWEWAMHWYDRGTYQRMQNSSWLDGTPDANKAMKNPFASYQTRGFPDYQSWVIAGIGA